MAVFGDRLRFLRESRKITQIGLSTLLGISQEAISAYERKESMPNIDVLVEISRFFNVSIDYLLGLDNVKKRISERELDEFEIALITNYRKLEQSEQELLIKIIALTIEYNERKV